MKCKVFQIHFNDEASGFEESKLNNFLETASVQKTFASVVGDEILEILNNLESNPNVL